MSELFDSLNFNASAGPSSSQSSQPSTSKVYWHASPSPGVLQQLRSWVPSKDQKSPTVPLCTQAFVGELRKLPASSSLQSPLVSKSGAKRKLTAGFSAVHHHGTVLSDDDDDDEVHSDTERSKRIAANRPIREGDNLANVSPESRRLLDAGQTGRFRYPTPDSTTSTLSLDAGPAQPGASRRSERRPVRRRKKDSFIAGLGLSDNQGKDTDCLKLFEDLQAAIKDMQSHSTSRPSGKDEPTEVANVSSQQDGKLTPRGLINRTTSAPTPVENARQISPGIQEPTAKSTTHIQTRPRMETDVVARRMFTPIKSDHDVFRASLASQGQQREVLRSTTNLTANGAEQNMGTKEVPQQVRSVSPDNAPITIESRHEGAASLDDDAVEITHVKHAETPMPKADDAEPQPSPVKRSARIEAMHGSTGKKLGVRVSPSVARSRTHSPAKPQAARTPQRSRSNVLPGMSQARQPGLPRNGSQFTSSQAQSSGPSVSSRSGPPAGLRAPFRPPARAQPLSTNQAVSPSNGPSSKRRCQQPSSSDDSFPDEDDDFLALACQLEY